MKIGENDSAHEIQFLFVFLLILLILWEWVGGEQIFVKHFSTKHSMYWSEMVEC